MRLELSSPWHADVPRVRGRNRPRRGVTEGQNKKRKLKFMNNKHYRKSSIVRVALLLALTASGIGLFPLFSSSALAFGVSDLNGNYGARNAGWAFEGMPRGNATANWLIPFNTLVLISFKRAGIFTGNQIVFGDGVATPHSISGTYTVETDGRGTMTWT